jgi:hypothetical protein
MTFPRLALAALLALTAAHAAPAADAPGNYAARWPLQLPADASLIRLPLPAEVLTQAQSADLRDLRVFNAAGQPVPLALDRFSPETRAAAPAAAPIVMPALPILGQPQTGNASAGMGLRIEESAAGRVVRLDVPPASADAAPQDAPPGPLAGALVDTREQQAALQAIELDATWPAARPFTFYLHASADLRQWQPLGEVTAYRGDDGSVTAPARVELHGVSLHTRYLRITWDTAATPQAVQVRAVRLLPVAAQAAPQRIAVPLALPDAGRDPRVIEWRLPFATPIAALDIRAGGPATLVPVRVLARQQREQPWTPLARHVVFSLTQDGRIQHSPALELGQASAAGQWREWRVEADPSSAGFPAAPQVTAWLAPAQLVFMASGQPPFTLAAGRADAPAAYLPLASLIPGYQPGAQDPLPAAAFTASPTAAVPTTAAGAQNDARQWTLWAVLVAGVLLLGGMAWTLVRQLNR